MKKNTGDTKFNVEILRNEKGRQRVAVNHALRKRK